MRCLPLLFCLCFIALICGCTKAQFLENFQPPPPQPLIMEGFTLHHSKAGLETQRVEGETARYYDDCKQLEITQVRSYFYDGKEPNSQTSFLRSDLAIIYMSDQTTSSGDHIRGDIEFIGNVVFLERVREICVETSHALYHDRVRTMDSDQPSTSIDISGRNVVVGHGKKGFVYDMKDPQYKMKMVDSFWQTLPPETSELTRARIHGQIASIRWVSGPDDIPVPLIPPKEGKP